MLLLLDDSFNGGVKVFTSDDTKTRIDDFPSRLDNQYGGVTTQAVSIKRCLTFASIICPQKIEIDLITVLILSPIHDGGNLRSRRSIIGIEEEQTWALSGKFKCRCVVLCCTPRSEQSDQQGQQRKNPCITSFHLLPLWIYRLWFTLDS